MVGFYKIGEDRHHSRHVIFALFPYTVGTKQDVDQTRCKPVLNFLAKDKKRRVPGVLSQILIARALLWIESDGYPRENPNKKSPHFGVDGTNVVPSVPSAKGDDGKDELD